MRRDTESLWGRYSRLTLLLLGIAGQTAGYAADEALEQALQAARQEDYATALTLLQGLAESQPQSADIVHEYLTVLVWAERYNEALASADRLLGPYHKSPPRVLELLGLSARRLKQPELAEHYYRLALFNAPDRLSSQLGLAFALAEQRGDTAKRKQAQELIAKLQAEHPRTAAPLLGQAHLAELERDFFSAMAWSEKALEREPGNREAAANLIRLADQLGAPTLAIELAGLYPTALGKKAVAELRQNAIASRIRTGVIDAEQKDHPQRLDSLRAVIGESDALAQRLAAEPSIQLSTLQRRALFDRLDALYEAERPAEAVALATLLESRAIPLPAYVKKNLAGAYLDLGRAGQAVVLYRQYLEAEPKDFDARLGLFSALVDNGRLEEAEAWIEKLVQDTPERIEAYSEATIRNNPHYRTALAARTMLRVYAGRLAEAQALADQLLEAAPYSAEFRETRATVAQARGFPRQAEAFWHRTLIDDSGNLAARAGRVQPLLAMHEFAEARRMVQSAQVLRPDSGSTRAAVRELAGHDAWDFNTDAGVGTSTGGNNPTGSDDLYVDSSLYSQPLAENWRAFLRNYFGQGKYQEGTVEWNRTTLGGEYRGRDLTVAAGISEGLGGKPGGSVEAEWQIDDYWQVKGQFDSVSHAFPLRAWLHGIDANRLAAETTWRRDETREIGAGASYMHFSDGNERYSLMASWSEQLWSGPKFRSDLVGSIWASSNSRRDTPYYNPTLDLSPNLTLHNDWATWRHGSINFHQHLNLTAGAYFQEGFGAGKVLEAFYQHAWEIGPRLTFAYGFGSSLHPYDGQEVAHHHGTMTLNWKF
jgi:biofilm PGA synthesis protein PgaA